VRIHPKGSRRVPRGGGEGGGGGVVFSKRDMKSTNACFVEQTGLWSRGEKDLTRRGFTREELLRKGRPYTSAPATEKISTRVYLNKFSRLGLRPRKRMKR